MGYRKFKADQLFTGKQFAPPGSVLVVLENGQIEAVIRESEAGDGLERIDGILCPGFINSHCHLELSHMKGLVPAGTGMVPFLLAVMQQRNTNLENLQEAISGAETVMIDSGIVAVGDICNTADTLNQKLKNRLTYINFIECSGFVPGSAGIRFEAAQRLLLQLAVTGKSSIVPHAPYSVSPELFGLIRQSATGQVSTMHNQESEAENDFFLTGTSSFQQLFKSINVDISFFRAPNKTSLQAVWPWLNNPGRLILVHNTVTSQEDLDTIQQNPTPGQDIYFCLCPNANLYINNQLPPVELLVNARCKIVLGTDSLSSNHQLSIIDEMKTLLQAFPAITMEMALTWATVNGAEALGISDQFGCFESGKKPGLVQIDEWKSRRIL